jgi:type IV pilus biogenesis protein CpaD/CtpE
MKRLKVAKTALLCFSILYVQACSTPNAHSSGIDAIEPITSEAVLSYTIDANATELSKHEKTRINAFLASLHLGSDDHLIVTIPRAHNPTQNSARRHNIQNFLMHHDAQITINAPTDLAIRPPLNSQLTKTTQFPGKYSTAITSSATQHGILRAVRTNSLRIKCVNAYISCANERNLANMIVDSHTIFKPEPTKTQHIRSKIDN